MSDVTLSTPVETRGKTPTDETRRADVGLEEKRLDGYYQTLPLSIVVLKLFVIPVSRSTSVAFIGQRVSDRDIVKCCVLRGGSGGFLQDSVDEFLSLKQGKDLLVAVETAPTFLGTLDELEHHRQAGPPVAIALGALVA